MPDEGVDGLDRTLSSRRCKRGYCKQYPNGNVLLNGNWLGLSKGTTHPVTLKLLSWNVAGLSEDSTDIFLSQISMITEWDVLLLQEYFRKLDGVNSGVHCTQAIHADPSGQAKAVGGGSRWTAVELDGQLTVISAHLPHSGKKLGDFETEIQDPKRGRLGQHLKEFNASFMDGQTIATRES